MLQEVQANVQLVAFPVCGCLSSGGKKLSKTFSRRIIWRDLAYWQLHHWPDMAVKPIRNHYEGQVTLFITYKSSSSGNTSILCFALNIFYIALSSIVTFRWV